jgi:hypothetical protein
VRRYLVASLLGIGLLAGTFGQAAFAGSSTYYAGKNAQGQKLLFTVDHTRSGPRFDPIFINHIVRCPVTGEVITVQFSFQGFRIPVRNGKFNLVLNDLSDLLRWSGTVTAKGASGKESIDLAGFDTRGGLQDCGAGSLSWKARALVPASAAAAAPNASYVVKVTKTSDGSVHYSTTN